MGEGRLGVQLDCSTSAIRSSNLVRLRSILVRMEERERKTDSEKTSVDAGQLLNAKTLTGGQNVQFN